MLKMGGKGSVFGDRCPPICEDFYLRRTGIDHRLNRQNHTGFESETFSTRPIVWDLRFLMECPAYSVADELPYHAVSKAFNILLHSVPNVENAISFTGFSDSQT
jgi:hypothetical protein